MARNLPFLASLAGLALAQMPGSSMDNHPKLTSWKCTKAGGCVAQDTSVVIDASSHWIHQKADQSKGCGSWGSAADPTACPTVEACQQNCIIEGISDYSTYGVETKGGSMTLTQLKPDGTTASPRLYLLAPGGKEYEMLQLTGKEFTFDVDASKLPCGMNGALYLSEMAKDGGASLTKMKTGGAPYGSGYCDAQCFTTPFINGLGNVAGHGACCNEMDIWEANSAATALTPHTCSEPGLFQCTGDQCKFNGTCDQWGCSYNAYINGAKNFYGKGSQFAVDTSKPFTVVTQFPADANGKLEAIKRLYVQDGKIIPLATAKVGGPAAVNYIDEGYCNATASTSRFQPDGGMHGIGDALSRGMVLAFSIWWDDSGNMTWLDSGNAGPCTADEGNPSVIQKVQPDTQVTFSNVKWGEIDSTYSGSKMSSRLF